jgi:hypothetical protein
LYAVKQPNTQMYSGALSGTEKMPATRPAVLEASTLINLGSRGSGVEFHEAPAERRAQCNFTIWFVWFLK